MEMLKIENLSFEYSCYDTKTGGTKPGKAILNNLSFSVSKGSVTLLCGPTGCGKSTLLKLIKSECQPSGNCSGEILFSGKNITELSEKERAEKISLLFQNPEDQIVTDKVWHEIIFSLENLGISQSAMESRLSELLAFFRLEPLAYENTCDLSGGQKQMVNLASVMSTFPELLLLDEPISQLDPEASELFVNTLTKLHKKLGLTTIIAEHNIEPFMELADRIIVLDEKANITFDGTIDEAKLNLASDAAKDKTMDGAYPTAEQKLEKTVNPNQPSPNHSLQIKNLYYRYPLSKKDTLCDLSICFEPGNIYSIFGVNGSGKTTLLNLITGILKPTGGKINTKAKIAYLPQNVETLFINSEDFDLSGGEKQLRGFEIILSATPDIILLDEPTKGMDEHCKSIFARNLANLKEQGKTIILSTHDLYFSSTVSDYCSILSMGKLGAFRSASKFFNENKLFTLPEDQTAHIITRVISKCC